MSKIASLLLLVALAAACRPTAPASASTHGRVELDDIIPWLKIEYYPKNPKCPAYLAGKPSVIPISQLSAIFSSVHSDVEITNANYSYCNLSPTQWTALRGNSPSVYPVAWSPAPDQSGHREIATVDLKSDVFGRQTITEQDFTNDLAQMENIIRKKTGQNDFSLSLINTR